MNRKKAFTLIELLVVIAIIGILSTIVVVSYNNIQERSRISKAKSDVNSLASAAKMLFADTKEYPFHYNSKCSGKDAPSGSVGSAQSYSNNSSEIPFVSHKGDETIYRDGHSGRVPFTITDIPAKSGLVSNGDNYNNWAGPYIDQIPDNDPWGGQYIFDPDHYCKGSGGVYDEACKGISVKGDDRLISIESHGKGKNDEDDGDEITVLICKP